MPFMKTNIYLLFSLVLGLILFALHTNGQQEDGWSEPFLISDTLTDNRNVTIHEIEYYAGYDFYAFWEKKLDDSTTAIYSRMLYDLDDQVEVLSTPGIQYTNPQVIPSYYGLDTTFVLFYHTNENDGIDIHYRFYTNDQFSPPFVLSDKPGDDDHLRVNNRGYMVWERNDSIFYTELSENNLFDQIELISSNNCLDPVIIKADDWGEKVVAWEKVVDDSSHIYMAEYDYSGQQWNGPILISGSGNNTFLQFASSMYGMNPLILSWDHQDAEGHTVNIYDIWDVQLYEFDFRQDQPTYPAIFTYLIPVNDWLDGAFPSFIKHDTGFVNIMAHEYGFFSTYLSEYISITADTLQKYHIQMFQGDIYGQCYHDIINTWEVEKEGNRQIWASIYDLCLWGGVKEADKSVLNLKISPNPAYDKANISCKLPEPASAQINIYDSSGRLVWEVEVESDNDGNINYEWTTKTGFSGSGMFLVRVSAGGVSGSEKVVVQ